MASYDISVVPNPSGIFISRIPISVGSTEKKTNVFYTYQSNIDLLSKICNLHMQTPLLPVHDRIIFPFISPLLHMMYYIAL